MPTRDTSGPGPSDSPGLRWSCRPCPSTTSAREALVLSDPARIEQPFFSSAPGWALIPLVVLTTATTVIASQAVISGTFSLTRKAVQLGYLPRLTIHHTSEEQMGQIYIPAVNITLMVACIGLVVGFRTSSNLASAYGVAVTTDMVFTTLPFGAVVYARWGWHWLVAGTVVAFFLTIDLGFWVANLPLDDFIDSIAEDPQQRVPGTAVYMDSNREGTPKALLHNLEHNRVLHERVIMLTVVTMDLPYADPQDRVETTPLGENMWRTTFRFGFSEDPRVHDRLSTQTFDAELVKPMELSYFLGRERLIPSDEPGMAIWRERLFALMSRNATGATAYFWIPHNQMVELGAQLKI